MNLYFCPNEINISPGMQKMIFESDNWYQELIDYIENETDYSVLSDEMIELTMGIEVPEGAYGEAYFEDFDGYIVKGQLNGPTTPNGCKTYYFISVTL